MNTINPCILRDEERPQVAYDIFSTLLSERIIFIGEDIDDELANSIVAQLLYLDTLNHTPIKMYINSPGGVITSGMAIYDTMNLIKSPVYTFALGQACSFGAILLTSGQKGHRYALPHARIMIHQPSGGSIGQSSDIQITAKLIDGMKQELAQILADTTGQPLKKVLKDSDRDLWMTSEEALKYGLIDAIVSPRSMKKSTDNEKE